PQQPEGRVGHPVGPGLARLAVMVEHPVPDVVDDAVEVIRHHEAPRHLDVGTQDLQKRGGKHIVGVELAGMGKAAGWYLHSKRTSCLVNECVRNSIPHFGRACKVPGPRCEIAAAPLTPPAWRGILVAYL